MLKGKTTIELTDVMTGKVVKHEHENMITNAVKDFCKGNGCTQSSIMSPVYRRFGSLAEDMFGGIMLWQNALSLTSADDYDIPTDNTCIGYGCEVSNGTINDKMGTFNQAESGVITNGYRFVWDFATSQANGTISAVSLVPRIAGQLGYGLSYEKYANSLNAPSTDFTTFDTINVALCCPFLFVKDNILYGVKCNNFRFYPRNPSGHISRNGKKLIIERYRFPVDEINLMDRPNVFTSKLSDIEVTLPAEFDISDSATYYYGFCNYDNGYIYLCIGTSQTASTITTQICKIDVDDWTCSIININAPLESSVTWCADLRGGWLDSEFSVTDVACDMMLKTRVVNNKLWIANSTSYFIDFTAPNIAQKIYYPDNVVANLSNGFYPVIGKHIYCANNSSVVGLVNLDTNKVFVLNSYKNNLKGVTYSGESGENYSRWIYHIPVIGRKFMVMFRYRTSDSYQAHFTTPPHVMTTKNNLETAVTKTNGQTMKVTYTLTETA